MIIVVYRAKNTHNICKEHATGQGQRFFMGFHMGLTVTQSFVNKYIKI